MGSFGPNLPADHRAVAITLATQPSNEDHIIIIFADIFACFISHLVVLSASSITQAQRIPHRDHHLLLAFWEGLVMTAGRFDEEAGAGCWVAGEGETKY